MDDQAIINTQNLEFHRAIATRLLTEPEWIDRATVVVRNWQAAGMGPLADLWAGLLQGPSTQIVRTLTADVDERAAWLRSASPFLQMGALPQAERLAIIRRVRAKAA